MKTTKIIDGRKIMEFFDDKKAEFEECLNDFRDFLLFEELYFPLKFAKTTWTPSITNGIPLAGLECLDRNEWERHEGYAVSVLMCCGQDFDYKNDELDYDDLRAYTILTLPGGKRKAAHFQPVFFNRF